MVLILSSVFPCIYVTTVLAHEDLLGKQNHWLVVRTHHPSYYVLPLAEGHMAYRGEPRAQTAKKPAKASHQSSMATQAQVSKSRFTLVVSLDTCLSRDDSVCTLLIFRLHRSAMSDFKISCLPARNRDSPGCAQTSQVKTCKESFSPCWTAMLPKYCMTWC